MRTYRSETYSPDLDKTAKIETDELSIIEVAPQVIEFKPIPKWSTDDIALRALNLDLSLRRSA